MAHKALVVNVMVVVQFHSEALAFNATYHTVLFTFTFHLRQFFTFFIIYFCFHIFIVKN